MKKYLYWINPSCGYKIEKYEIKKETPKTFVIKYYFEDNKIINKYLVVKEVSEFRDLYSFFLTEEIAKWVREINLKRIIEHNKNENKYLENLLKEFWEK